MSSGVDTPDDLKHCPQSPCRNLALEDQSVTQSSILYLLQEATKLATPLSQYTSITDGLHINSQGDTTSSILCNPTSSSLKDTQATLTGAFSVLNSIQTSSPWEVMSLINLQCERLLHCGQTCGEEGDFYACTTSKTNNADVTDCSSVVKAGQVNMCTSTESSRENPPVYGPTSDLSCSVPHVLDNHLFSNQTADEFNDDTEIAAAEDLAELISKNTADILHFSNASVMSEERTFLTEASVVPKKLDACEQPPLQSAFNMQEAVMLNVPSTAQSPRPEISSVDFMSYLDDYKDGNSSIGFNFNACEPDRVVVSKMPQSPQPDSVILSRTDLNNNLEFNKDVKFQEPEEDQATSSAQHSLENCRRIPRKQAHPARSPDLQDPELQGVTFSMHPELDSSTGQCRLLITSKYRCGRRGKSTRSRSLQSSQRTSSSEEESDSSSLTKKICASCCTKKTPLWRDAEDGTPLCNACGIRYKKYRVRCLQCWNIPRKEANSNSKCLKCGDLLHVASQYKRAGW